MPWSAYQLQAVEGDAFRILFTFDLPAIPDNVNIDYAVISFGLNIKSSTNRKLLEILSADNSGQGAASSYNQNPATAVISKHKLGLTQTHLDITQLVDSWVNGNAVNEGILLVSHRAIPEKAFQAEKVALAPQFKKASIKTFYTRIES